MSFLFKHFWHSGYGIQWATFYTFSVVTAKLLNFHCSHILHVFSTIPFVTRRLCTLSVYSVCFSEGGSAEIGSSHSSWEARSWLLICSLCFYASASVYGRVWMCVLDVIMKSKDAQVIMSLFPFSQISPE